jgi:hypothetical protein
MSNKFVTRFHFVVIGCLIALYLAVSFLGYLFEKNKVGKKFGEKLVVGEGLFVTIFGANDSIESVTITAKSAEEAGDIILMINGGKRNISSIELPVEAIGDNAIIYDQKGSISWPGAITICTSRHASLTRSDGLAQPIDGILWNGIYIKMPMSYPEYLALKSQLMNKQAMKAVK